MNITITNDQTVVLTVLRAAGVDPKELEPVPPHRISDGIMPLWAGAWVIFVTEVGKGITLHLEQASKREAWDYFHAQSNGTSSLNPRLVVCHGKSEDSVKN